MQLHSIHPRKYSALFSIAFAAVFATNNPPLAGDASSPLEFEVQTSKAIGILYDNPNDPRNYISGTSGAAPVDTQKTYPVPIMVIDKGFWKDNGFVFDKDPDAIHAPKGHLQEWTKESYKPLTTDRLKHEVDHGTFVTGIIGGALPQKGGFSTGFARLIGTQKDSSLYLCDFSIESVEYCLVSYLRGLRDSAPEFVNISLGCGGFCASNGFSKISRIIDNTAFRHGALVVVAAGNQGRNKQQYDLTLANGKTGGLSREEWPGVPSMCGAKNALCVGSVTNEYAPQFFFTDSNDGMTDDGRIKPDIYAINRFQSNCFKIKDASKPSITKPCTDQGTSMSAPMVTATLAVAAANNPDWRGKPHAAKAWAILAATRTDDLSKNTVGGKDGRTGYLRYNPAVQNTNVATIRHGVGTGETAQFDYRLPKASARRNRVHAVLVYMEGAQEAGISHIGTPTCEGFDNDPECRYVVNELHLAVRGEDGSTIASSEDAFKGVRDTVRHMSFCLNNDRIPDNRVVKLEMLAADVPDIQRYPYNWALGASLDYHKDCE